MSYQVLARKWRPRTFREMVGQEHVLKALINALDHNRLHHAYLFTGTRGVGKTTIARILARCLNCEVGISSAPCGECSACREINEGRFIDLIEVDAASRTKVEDTRELLDNVQYAPTRGRFKIYLIDEVHMLSNHSFNALLKTLEEPPAHVKFLLATTDPQKLPITILSRCLQFNLKNMSPERIVQHLHYVLTQEMVPFDEAALWQLARSADGSMRDALSLTDQAIAFGSGKVSSEDVTAMLGTIDHRFIEKLMLALIEGDGATLLQAVAQFSEQSPDYYSALGDLITLLHRIAIAQALPEAVDNSYGDREQILKFAQMLTPEDVQLFYQTGLLGRRDLPLAPDPRSGFEMTLLRMLAFKPQGLVDIPTRPLAKQAVALPDHEGGQPAKKFEPEPKESPARAALMSALQAPPAPRASNDLPAEPPKPAPAPPPPPVAPPVSAEPPVHQAAPVQPASVAAQSTPVSAPPKAPTPVFSAPGAVKTLGELEPENWIAVYQALNVRGILQSTAANCILAERRGNHLFFALDQDKGSLFDASHRQRLADLLQEYFAEPVQVTIEVRELPAGVETPAMWLERQKREAREAAIQRLRDDPLVQQLERELGATLDEESVTYS
ncbi:DNA polymerase III subunit gamma/tau [Saccharophagus sp. K07]|uniref:DNA polymerase III subunit gamma/tau n=1 Tax=Saccharophagus sp. K07 TaxID=2283636 RepID=UPI00165209D4|nr:DNA polymerase III subunit gamma/tau [Saccharophagus sp. K07]